MKAVWRTGATALALTGMMGQAMAGTICARPQEALALKTAAMQQEMMVAALYCNDVKPYNHFVLSHQRELQASDAMLLAYFKRADGARAGETAYHAYKTGLANDFSLAGLHGMQAYCATANAAFDAADSPSAGPTLATFISTQSVAGAEAYASCEQTASDKVRGGSSSVSASLSEQN
jgi:hypothetical protein